MAIPVGRYGQGDVEMGLPMHPRWPEVVRRWRAVRGKSRLPSMVIVRHNGDIECYAPEYTNGPFLTLPPGTL
jgi:hypothetical protein